MKKIALPVLSLTIAAAVPTFASISLGSSGSLVVVAAPESRTVAVALTLPAEFVSVPLRISSDQKSSALAYEESRQAIDLIAEKAKDRFRVVTGVASLSQQQKSKGISSGFWSQPAAEADIYLLVPLTQERDNIFAAGAVAARFVETLSLPGKARCQMGKLALAVENPEQHRAKLLGQIAQEIRKCREALAAAGTVTVQGLDSAVLVRQADDRHVELFLNYSLSLTDAK